MLEGCAIVQAVGSLRLKAEVWVRSQVSSRRICGGQYAKLFRLSGNTFTFSRLGSVMSGPLLTPFDPIWLPASGGPQFTGSACLI